MADKITKENNEAIIVKANEPFWKYLFSIDWIELLNEITLDLHPCSLFNEIVKTFGLPTPSYNTEFNTNLRIHQGFCDFLGIYTSKHYGASKSEAKGKII